MKDGSPGFGTLDHETPRTRVKWLGGDGQDGPWIYWVERQAGEVIAPHKHKADRVEYIARGSIEWFEGEAAVAWYRDGRENASGTRYKAGTMTWVPAGTVYGYKILEDTDVMLWFYGSPGGTEYAVR
jgi:quercetin dioxygenase-like cupin family protein